MSQVDVTTSVGYALKRAQSALHAAMDQRLAEVGLSVSQYACLTLLEQRPGLTNAELARGVFVTRQATHQLLTGLRRAGLVDTTGSGRDQRLSLSRHGSTVLTVAAAAVRAVEDQMLAPLSATQRESLHRLLSSCVEALDPGPPPVG